MNALFLAFAHLRHHPVRSSVLLVLLALILTVPACLNLLLSKSSEQLMARAQATPLVIGRAGSQVDLIMSSLYFSDDRPALVSVETENAIWDSGYADAIPLYVRFDSGGAPIVGTSIDYFDFRGLAVSEGRLFSQLGEAVIGSEAAARLGVSVGDLILSSPENLFDLAGAYPLQMEVVGVLAPSASPDDSAVIVDVKTSWIIEGLGHGHQDVVDAAGDGLVTRAVAGIIEFNRITDENRQSFHFHGTAADFPLTSVIALPYDLRAQTILRGRYLADDATEQAVIPERVVDGLLAQILNIKRLFDAIMLVVLVATALAVGLVLFLSVQLRRGEGRTAYLIGAPRSVIWQLVMTEVAIVLLAACLLGLLLTYAIQRLADGILLGLI